MHIGEEFRWISGGVRKDMVPNNCTIIILGPVDMEKLLNNNKHNQQSLKLICILD